MGQQVFNYGMMYTEKGNKKGELVHSTPGCKKWINTKPKI